MYSIHIYTQYENGHVMPKFEWDERKNKSNKLKHGIDFKRATRIFDDPDKLKFDDTRAGQGERRWKVIGFILEAMFSVIYTIRNTTIRIISARRASKKERKRYWKNLEEQKDQNE